MKPKLPHPRSLLWLLGALAVIAILVAGAGARSHPRAAASADLRGQAVAPAPAAVVAATAPATPHRTPRHARRRATAATQPNVARLATTSPAEAGMRVYLDPETGLIGPPPNGVQIVPEMNPLNDSDEGLVQEVLPDGSFMVNLQGRFQEFMIVQMDPNGRRSVQCTQNPKAVLTSAPAPALKPVER